MAFTYKILEIDDENNFISVFYEDTSSGITKQIGMYLDAEYTAEELDDFIVDNWPYEVFAQRGKASANRHVEAKIKINQTVNATEKINARKADKGF